jgi:tRNA pseudouridine38-40 synthase
MPTYKLTVEYDGTKFHGWQFQPELRTVQGELQKALKVFLRQDIVLHAAGRTDTGVHALGQVASFRYEQELDPALTQRSLNGILKHDAVVKRVEIVADDFHARFSAIARQYFYVLSRTPVAIGRHYAFFCKLPLDLERMQRACPPLVGEHDFRAFCESRTEDPHFLSRVDLAQWEDQGERWIFRIRANRFLRSMVRILVGTMIDIGRGRMEPETMAEILAGRERRRAGFTAPPVGLFLEEVFYDGDDVK